MAHNAKKKKFMLYLWFREESIKRQGYKNKSNNYVGFINYLNPTRMKQIISYLSLKENLPGLKFKKKNTAYKQIIILHSWKQIIN